MSGKSLTTIIYNFKNNLVQHKTLLYTFSSGFFLINLNYMGAQSYNNTYVHIYDVTIQILYNISILILVHKLSFARLCNAFDCKSWRK